MTYAYLSCPSPKLPTPSKALAIAPFPLLPYSAFSLLISLFIFPFSFLSSSSRARRPCSSAGPCQWREGDMRGRA